MEYRKNDVFITNFWGPDEVCMVLGIVNGMTMFVRLEAIRDYRTATMENEQFARINKRPIHSSVWYTHSEESQVVYQTLSASTH